MCRNMSIWVPRRIDPSFWNNFKRNNFKITENDIKILYQSSYFIAIEKPYGIAVHSGPKVERSIEDFLPLIKKRLNLTTDLYLAHRLDKYCTGILLLSFNKESASFLAKSFQNELIQKYYLAVLLGVPSTSSGRIDVPISNKRIIPSTNSNYSDFKVHTYEELSNIQKDNPLLLPDGISVATTDYNMISKWTPENDDTIGVSLMHFSLKTGKKHQVRVHSSQVLKCPILGDHKFSRMNNRPQKIPHDVAKYLAVGKTWSVSKIPLHLHSHKIVIPDGPQNSAKMVEIISPIPEHLKLTIKTFNLLKL